MCTSDWYLKMLQLLQVVIGLVTSDYNLPRKKNLGRRRRKINLILKSQKPFIQAYNSFSYISKWRTSSVIDQDKPEGGGG